MGKNKPTKFLNWHIVFVQYCNLECSYCSTGFGRFGQKEPAYMNENVQRKLAERIFSYPNKKDTVSLIFGGGETFLKFEPFLNFVRHFHEEAKKHDVRLSIEVGTNGTAVDKDMLDACAKYRINLEFSIDGSAETHNRFRKDKSGGHTHERALKNWKYYKKITKDLPNPPACSIQSVYTGYSSLQDVLTYWEEQGEKILNVTVQEPSRFLDDQAEKEWEERRRAYLEDYKEIAFELASNLTIPGFLSDFSGPHSLYKIWKDIFTENSASPCGAGIDTLGVTPSGDLYPCETFIGNQYWKLGDINNGPDEKKLQIFQDSRRRVLEPCKDCETGPLCCGGCFKTGRGNEIIINSKGGCDFMKEMIKIGEDSYSLMKEQL